MTAVNLNDPVNKAFVENPALMNQVKNTLKPSMWDFPDNESLARLAAKTYERGGVVGAVCHGPSGLVNVKLSDGRYLVKGRVISSFTNEEEANFTEIVPFLLETGLVERGAKISKAHRFEAHVVASGRLVPGQNPASAKGVAESMVTLLKQTE